MTTNCTSGQVPWLPIITCGVFTANPLKLRSAYQRMVAAEKHRLMPERLVTLNADKPWIKAVSKHSQARQAFLEAAIDFCRFEKARASKNPRQAKAKPAIRRSVQKAHVP